MTREELRQHLDDGTQRIRNSPLWRFMKEDQRRLFLAVGTFWTQDNPITNAALDDVLALYPNVPMSVVGDSPLDAVQLVSESEARNRLETFQRWEDFSKDEGQSVYDKIIAERNALYLRLLVTLIHLYERIAHQPG